MMVPVFLLLMFGLFDFARLFFTYEALAGAAASGARSMAIITNSATTVYDEIAGYALILGPTATTGCTTTNAAPPSTSDCSSIQTTDSNGTTHGPDGCPLPPTPVSCSVPAATSAGKVDVTLTYHFNFLPNFIAPFGVALQLPTLTLTTTSEDYIG